MMIAQLKNRINSVLGIRHKVTAAKQAYDLWASSYDQQPNNLMLALDQQIFSDLLGNISIKDKVVVDIGCGTGRHWPELLSYNPASLTGYDISEGMLQKLLEKYPDGNVVKLKAGEMPDLEDQSVDVIVSTLTIAHIEDIDALVQSWADALKPCAHIIITDFHPVALAAGGKRTFQHKDHQISVLNYIHSIKTIIDKFAEHGFWVADLIERLVDDTIKPYYEKQNALQVYERFANRPIIYGLCLERYHNDPQ